jgi:hypothetical protein
MLRTATVHARRRRSLLAAVAALGALVLPAQAGAMTATAPVRNAAAPVHPVLRWTLAPGELTDTVEISDSPATTPAGDFLDEHRVDSDGFFNATTVWSPTWPMYAGAYWWHATGHDADYNDVRTRVEAFHVDPLLTGQKVSVTKYRWSRQLAITAMWTTNVRSVLVTFRVSRKGHTIWKRTVGGTTFVPMDQDQAFATWTNNRHKVKRGQKVRVTTTVTYAGRTGSVSRTVTAP